MINALKKTTNVGGLIVVSCTYQWNAKHIKNKEEAVDDIKEYFAEGWRLVSEAEHEYRIRFNDRFARQFLSSRSRLRKNRLEPHKKTEHLRLGFLVFGLEHNFK
ncbi:hypothetical protein VMC_28060 [Vibrio alginolyticus 40B]|nr:hypothetical protein VMC_28060 [Vibrio alginolyticus 40B]